MTNALKDYKILINPQAEFLESYQLSFEVYLFNESQHITQQADNQRFTFYLLNQKKKSLEARFSCFIVDNQVISPIRAPFGSIEFNPNIDLKALHFFWESIENHLKNLQIREISLNSYPFCYQPENSAMLTHLFLQKGFQIIRQELNYHLVIDNQDFSEKLHHSEQRRLRKCQKANFVFTELLNADLAFVYKFVAQARERKGFPISLSFKVFEALFQYFPENFKVFVVKNEEEILALSVVILVNQRILYNFYPADSAKYLNYSPLVFLYENIYEYAQTQGFQIFDLGISTENSEPNYGLIQFKRNLGAKTSLKLKFLKK